MPELLLQALRPDQVIYCSPLVDPYQPAESGAELMPRILDELVQRPAARLRHPDARPLITRDVDRVVLLARHTTVRISFSLMTNRDNVRRLCEPHCETMTERLKAMGRLRDAGLEA